MYIYHPLINALSSHMIHINLNMTCRAQSYQNNLHKVLYGKTNKHTHYTHTHTHTHTRELVPFLSTLPHTDIHVNAIIIRRKKTSRMNKSTFTVFTSPCPTFSEQLCRAVPLEPLPMDFPPVTWGTTTHRCASSRAMTGIDPPERLLSSVRPPAPGQLLYHV